MGSQKLNLARNNFEQCVAHSFKELHSQQEFLDVTLVCEDGKEIQAHKAVLGTCSSVLKNILLRNPHQHPLIYITGVSNDQLKSMIDFMYLGQTEIAEENVESFLRFASQFQVRGLIEEDVLVQPLCKTEPRHEKDSESKKEIILDVGNKFVEDIYNFGLNEVAENGEPIEENAFFDFQCNNCDYSTTQKGHLKRHIKSKHEGIKVKFQRKDLN